MRPVCQIYCLPSEGFARGRYLRMYHTRLLTPARPPPRAGGRPPPLPASPATGRSPPPRAPQARAQQRGHRDLVLQPALVAHQRRDGDAQGPDGPQRHPADHRRGRREGECPASYSDHCVCYARAADDRGAGARPVAPQCLSGSRGPRQPRRDLYEDEFLSVPSELWL